MKMPKFKPTKWKVSFCMNHKESFPSTWGHKECDIVERDNIPFFVPDMKFKYLGAKWARLKSDKFKQEFDISASKVHEVIMGCGIEPGGNVPNQWWIWVKVGNSETLKWVPSDE